MAGRQLRMRLVTIEPEGVFGPIHWLENKGEKLAIEISVDIVSQ